MKDDYIPVLGYFDEFETGNALGSHSGEQQFGGFYISLMCLPPRLMYKTENIFVSSVFRAKYLADYGPKMVFKKDINDLKCLHDHGLKLNLDSGQVTTHFSFMLYTGDNLGVNSITGFPESFNSTYYCRICRATHEECKWLTEEREDLIRNVENYESDLEHGTVSYRRESMFRYNARPF